MIEHTFDCQLEVSEIETDTLMEYAQKAGFASSKRVATISSSLPESI